MEHDYYYPRFFATELNFKMSSILIIEVCKICLSAQIHNLDSLKTFKTYKKCFQESCWIFTVAMTVNIHFKNWNPTTSLQYFWSLATEELFQAALDQLYHKSTTSARLSFRVFITTTSSRGMWRIVTWVVTSRELWRHVRCDVTWGATSHDFLIQRVVIRVIGLIAALQCVSSPMCFQIYMLLHIL